MKGCIPAFALLGFLSFAASALFVSSAQASDMVGPGRDCFSGPFETHEKWMTMLQAKLGGASGDAAQNLLQHFPKALFEQHKEQLDCSEVLYEVNGIHVRGFVLKPKSVNKPLPVLIYNRGGNGTFGSLMFSGEVWERLMPLAESGFVVLASQYRGGVTLLPQWKTAEDEFGGKDVDDVIGLLDLAAAMPEADMHRVGVLGHSRGGMMSYLVAKRDVRVRAIATIAGSVDLLHDLQQRPEMENVYRERIPDYATRKEDALRERSAIYWADQLRPSMPVLILHGEKDERVSFDNAQRMSEKLTELKHPFRLVTYADGDHGLRAHSSEVNRELVQWFKLVLNTPDAITSP